MATRKANGEGCLRKRGNGRWELRVMAGYLNDGKPNFQYFYGKTKREVQEQFEVFRDDQRNGLDFTHNYTFEAWSSIWFEHHRTKITPTTQENYRYLLNRLNEYFGQRSIRDIKPFDVEFFLSNQQAEGLSDSYLGSLRGMLHQIFHKAEANDLVRKNPVRFAEKMRSAGGPRQRKEAFTAEEVRLLMANLPNNKIGWSIRLLLGTGMRSQELLALEPFHIETDGSVIHIRQAVNLVKGSVFVGAPKSRDSYRNIPVPDSLRWCAMALRNVQTKFIWETGKRALPCNPTYFRKQYYKAIAMVEGVRLLSPHSCRHTYVSQMQALGIDLATIQSIVGHAEVEMTQHYLHVQDEIRQNAVHRFAEAFPVDPDYRK